MVVEAPMNWKTGGCHCGAVRLDEGQVCIARLIPFDGQNWEQGFADTQGKV